MRSLDSDNRRRYFDPEAGENPVLPYWHVQSNLQARQWYERPAGLVSKHFTIEFSERWRSLKSSQ